MGVKRVDVRTLQPVRSNGKEIDDEVVGLKSGEGAMVRVCGCALELYLLAV